MPAPWWIVKEHIPADLEPDREPRPHVHIDFLYAAVVARVHAPEGDGGSPAGSDAEGHAEGLAWRTASDLTALEMFDGTRTAAVSLFTMIDTLAPPTQPLGIGTCAR